MNHSSKINSIIALLIPALFLFFMLFTACEEEVEKIVKETVHDTTVVTVNDTTVVTARDTILVDVQVMVDSVIASPDSIAQGGTITLTAEASTAEEVGELSYFWRAAAGELSSETDDTVDWKAPDDPGAYKVSVHVTDGEYIGIGSVLVGVGMYAPTATPYYVGDDKCAICHSRFHDEWEQTGHADAWQTLIASGGAASFCFKCHSVGWEPEPFTGNSGYDEAPIAKFEDVQCENCHGPGSEHISTLKTEAIQVSYDEMNCGKCHEGEHHPYLSEWEESPHNFDPLTSSHGAGANGFCQGCHEGVAAAIRLSGDLSSFYGGGFISERPDTNSVSLEPVVCQTCHDPHSAENPGQLRTVDDVLLVEANGERPIVSEGGAGKLCMQCHHARRAPEPQIQNGYPFFGPHANPQADMMASKSAYHSVAESDFVWAGPSHLRVQNSCKTCHLNTVEFSASGPAVTGHKFEPTVDACVTCHGPINDFDEIMATNDFDGDGRVEGVQSEVQGLLDLLASALVADGLDTTGVGIAGALGDTTTSTFKQREAGYNWVFVVDDKSLGVHNPDYAVQLLQQSYKFITGNNIPNAKMVREDNIVAARW